MATSITSDILTGMADNAMSTTIRNKGNTLGRDEFMTMLLAQIKNQDPLNPMDGKDFAVQLAQFSSLQQLTNLNTTMNSLPVYLKSFTNAQMIGMVGNEAVVQGNTVNVNGSKTDISFSLPQNIQSGTIKIYDEKGMLVDTLQTGACQAGLNTVAWSSGNFPQGNYKYEISATDENAKTVNAETLQSGIITGVSFKNDDAYLTINGQDIAFSNIISVKKPSN